MIIFYNMLLGIAQILGMMITLLIYLFVIRALLSWFNPDPYNPIVRFLYSCTEPILSKIRRIIPTRIGMLDLSVIIVILVLIFLQSTVVQSIADYANLGKRLIH